MGQKQLILIVISILTFLTVSLAVYQSVRQNGSDTTGSSSPKRGMISLFKDGILVANLSPADLNKLPKVSFTEREREKSLEGWWLRDVLRLYLEKEQFADGTTIAISGFKQKRGEKTANLSWKEVQDPDAHVMLHPTKDGQSLKLVSTLDQLATRNQWIQGVMKININTHQDEQP